MTSNVNPTTGVRYGVTNAQNYQGLYDHIVDNGLDLNWVAYEKEWKQKIASLAEDLQLSWDDPKEVDREAIESTYRWLHHRMTDLIVDEVRNFFEGHLEGDLADILWDAIEQDISENYQCEDQSYELLEHEGTDEECHYMLSSLGGAPLLFVCKSPVITKVRSLCSPCVPGAGDLDSGYDEDGYECYGVPEEWEEEGDDD